METSGVKNIVLVHGGFVDGSGWEGVHQLLTKSGYTVTIVQNPTITLSDDVQFTKRALAAQNGPTILVGHSYGGVVITKPATHQRAVNSAPPARRVRILTGPSTGSPSARPGSSCFDSESRPFAGTTRQPLHAQGSRVRAERRDHRSV